MEQNGTGSAGGGEKQTSEGVGKAKRYRRYLYHQLKAHGELAFQWGGSVVRCWLEETERGLSVIKGRNEETGCRLDHPLRGWGPDFLRALYETKEAALYATTLSQPAPPNSEAEERQRSFVDGLVSNLTRRLGTEDERRAEAE